MLKRYGYAHDAAGNRTMARVDDAPTTFTYNNLNQLTSQAGGGVVAFSGTTNEPATATVAGKPATGAGGTTFAGTATLPAGTSTVAITATDASGNTATQSDEVDVATSAASSTYDANGNLITQGARTYEWDAADQLVRVLDTGTEIARFVYDGYGRRVEKTTAGTTRRYVYSGSNILEERSSSGTIRIVHGPRVDRPLASVDGSGTVSYYLADHLGSIVQQTDASAAVTQTRRYDPYGVPLQGAGTSGYAFTGREWDAEIGLYYYRARYYDPGRGRFLSADPIGLAGGPNLYAYVDGNPVNRLDPSGLWSKAFWRGGGDVGKGIVAGVAAAATVIAIAAAVGVSAPVIATAAVVVGTAGLLLGVGGALYEGYRYYNGTLTVEEADYAAGGAVVAGVAMLVGGAVAWRGRATAAGASCAVAPKPGSSIALGSRFGGLRTFASERGADHLLDAPAAQWKNVFLTRVGNPSARFSVNMKGFFGNTPAEMILNEMASGSNTGWELQQLRQAGRLGAVMFYDQIGNLIANPFK